ncbi:hypothetical protein BLNAU_2768 [Blattamonas nauphoetae]|uniref:Uncharacterized protein n=1 Tax=Blattamonas nauphoetae TaxID=2049346 RepID=A0ABQ9WWN0_9EUKA|nr:hypothetical protein BLNAU_21975 [Blattamonas nauphoetae]KAK2958662.1 hypothetical protein BLNAU_6431 [Blattamonas nauphoetae]KAK2962108.1 hypothetical protein BLNAU_2768 [Blattamonas nauphoetae]
MKFTGCTSGMEGGGLLRFGGGTSTFNVTTIEIKNFRLMSCQGLWGGGGIFMKFDAGTASFLIDSVGYGNTPEETNTVGWGAWRSLHECDGTDHDREIPVREWIDDANSVFGF